MRLAFSNGKIFTGQATESQMAILVNDGKVEALVSDQEIPSSYSVQNIGGNTIAPALIDMQIYGGNGKMFSHETTTAAIQSTYEYCLGGGCAWFMITMATNSIEKFVEGIEEVKKYTLRIIFI